jgi:activator of HSP90 ATPase
MSTQPMSRRRFGVLATAMASSLGTARLALGRGGAPAGAAPPPGTPATPPENGLSHNSEAILQKVAFHAPRAKVYAILTDGRQFDEVARRSDAMRSAKAPAGESTISREVGGAFRLFGGFVTGLQVELVPDQRIVQVWRSGSWGPGEYSLVTFMLGDQDGGGTQLVLSHRGFPPGTGTHLAAGWHLNYWQPLTEYLAAK